MTCERACESPQHHPNCKCVGCHLTSWCGETNVDHITGRAIAKELGWNRKTMSSRGNVQNLSRACHREKDRNTNFVLRDLRQQKRGRFIGLGEHSPIGMDTD